MNKTLDYYDKNSSLFINDTVNAKMNDALQSFEAELHHTYPSRKTSEIHVLDLGCGSGRDTKYFLQQGYMTEALDGSKELANIASKYTEINVKLMDFHDFHDISKYDGIWACASILHLPLKDLPRMFQQIYEALHQEGILYTTFKYGTFEGYRNERYYTDLDEDRLNTILQETPGFHILKEWISKDVRPGRNEE